jgi:hypothetical protein
MDVPPSWAGGSGASCRPSVPICAAKSVDFLDSLVDAAVFPSDNDQDEP